MSSHSSPPAAQSMRQPLLAETSDIGLPAIKQQHERTSLLAAAPRDSFGAADSALQSDVAADSTTAAADSSNAAAPTQLQQDNSAAVAAAARGPPKAPWMLRAERCVRGFERRKQLQLRRKEWGVCTLSFPNIQQEKEYSWYLANLRERNMRGVMLLLSFAYMLYATVEWRDTADYRLTISRGAYVGVVLLMFAWSYARPTTFRIWLQEWTLALCGSTALNILVEASLLQAVYSPFVVIILLLFLLASSVLVRLRFIYTSALCWATVLLYDLICLTRFRSGDDYLRTEEGSSGGASAAEVAKWLVWYNCVQVFTVLVVQKIAHRVEVQSRYEFLTTVSMTQRKVKKKRAQKAQRQLRRTQKKLEKQYREGVSLGAQGSLAAPNAASATVGGSADVALAAAATDEGEERKEPATMPPLVMPRRGSTTMRPAISPPSTATAGGDFSGVGSSSSRATTAAAAVGAAAEFNEEDDWASEDEFVSSSDDENDEDDGGEEEEEDESALLGLDVDESLLLDSNGTLKRLNASLQKTLHDLLFTPATIRQRVRIEAEEEEKHPSHHHHHHNHGGRSHQRQATSSSDSPPIVPVSAPAGSGMSSHLLDSASHTVSAAMRPRSSRPTTRRTRADSQGSSSSFAGGAPGDDESSSAAGGAGAGADDVPVDQMSLITKALAESGVGDMRTFLRVLAAKPDPPKRTTFGTNNCDELPTWFLSYPNILSGYRVNFSAQMCLQSAFKWHNETLNVWSEFIPALGFFIAFFYILSNDSVLLAASTTDRAFVAVGLFGAQVVRPLISGFAHLMYPQSQRSYILWWGADYASICLSIYCSCAVFGRFAFYCLPDQQSFFYVSLTGLFFSTIVAVLFVSSNGVRTGSFLLFVLFATGVPFWYTLADKWAGGAAHNVPQEYVTLWLASLGCFVIGLGFKSSGFPESLSCACIRPGAFDVVGGSHAWWHLCINVGNALVYPVWRHYLQFRQANSC